MHLDQAIKTLIKHQKFFPKLDHNKRTQLLLHAELKTFQKGEVIYTIHTPTECMYFIVEGSVKLNFKGDKISLTSGEYFGSEAILGMASYATNAIAEGNVTLITIAKHHMQSILDHKDLLSDELKLPFIKFSNNHSHTEKETEIEYSIPLCNPTIGWAITFLIGILTYIYTDYFSHSGRIFLSISAITISIMSFRLLEDFISTLFAILLCLGFGITNTEIILSNFGSTSFLTALSFFGIGSVILSSGLVLRLLVWIIKYLPAKYSFINSGLFFLGAGLTPVIPDLQIRSEMMSNTFYDTSRLLQIKPKSTTTTSLAFLFFSSVSILGPVFLSSCMDNFIILSMFWGQYQQEFQWLGWLKAALVPGIFIIVGYGLVHILMFRKSEPIEVSKEIIQSKSQALGPINIREWTSLISIAACFLGMATTFYHHIPPEIVSFLVLTCLLAFNFITSEEFRSKIPWDDLIFFMGLTGVIATATDIGLINIVATKLSWIANYMEFNFPMFVIVMFGIMSAISLVFPIEFVTISLLIILVPIAQLNNISPWVIAFVILMLGEVWFHPMQKSDYRWFKFLVSEECAYDEPKLLRANALLSIIKLASIFVSIPYWRHLGLLS